MKGSFLISGMLIFSEPALIFSAIFIIYCWLNRTIAAQLIGVVGICILINVALKTFFHVPVAAHLGHVGFAFPSGHTQYSTVFYLWLAYQFRSRFLRCLMLPIIAGVAYGLVAVGYHSETDVIWGAIVGLGIVLGFALMIAYLPKSTPYILLIAATSLLIYNIKHYTRVPIHTWVAYVMVGVYCALSANLKDHSKLMGP